ncbi:MAG: hypothetical protein HYV60_21660 [Planctomycetia bacterium]|nr:hypothetical protein [Planctomycetia bacterium]
MSQTLTTHIQLDDRGVAWIDDSNVKVIEVALDKIAHGLSPEEICDQHDGYLSMSQIHAALMHYYDHQTEFDAEIDRQLADYKQARDRSLDSPGRRRLRALGKLS